MCHDLTQNNANFVVIEDSDEMIIIRATYSTL